ncbi:hypothetical protein Tco_1021033 [Tanacetum coccineum]
MAISPNESPRENTRLSVLLAETVRNGRENACSVMEVRYGDRGLMFMSRPAEGALELLTLQFVVISKIEISIVDVPHVGGGFFTYISV